MANFRNSVFSLIGLGLLLVAAAPALRGADGLTATGQDSMRDVTILFQADQEGKIEPCG